MITSWCDVINALNGAFHGDVQERAAERQASKKKRTAATAAANAIIGKRKMMSGKTRPNGNQSSKYLRSVYTEMNSNCVNANGDMTIQLYQFPNGIINICWNDGGLVLGIEHETRSIVATFPLAFLFSRVCLFLCIQLKRTHNRFWCFSFIIIHSECICDEWICGA